MEKEKLDLANALQTTIDYYNNILKKAERVYLKDKGELVYFCGGSDYYAFSVDDELVNKALFNKLIEEYIFNLKAKIHSLEVKYSGL